MFVVVPLIEESEQMEGVDNALAVYEQMKEMYPRHSIGLMHGKMKPKEKDEVMSDFKSSKLQILVSTTVIEV
jgi:ATP-dependent DNA helicase RecG